MAAAVFSDASRIAVEVWDGKSQQIWVVDVATGEATQVTYAGIDNAFPVWTADGKSVVFSGTFEGVRGLHRKPVDGSGEATSLGVAGEVVPTDVSRDGTLLFSLGDQTAERAIWRLSLDDLSAKEILQTAAQEHHAMFSPGALDCLCIERIWPTGDLRPAIPHRPGNRATCIRRGRRWARLGAG